MAKMNEISQELEALIDEHQLKCLELLGLARLTPKRKNSPYNLNQNSVEWHKERKVTLAASEVAMAMNESPFGSARDLLLRKYVRNVETSAMQRVKKKKNL